MIYLDMTSSGFHAYYLNFYFLAFLFEERGPAKCMCDQLGIIENGENTWQSPVFFDRIYRLV